MTFQDHIYKKLRSGILRRKEENQTGRSHSVISRARTKEDQISTKMLHHLKQTFATFLLHFIYSPEN